MHPHGMQVAAALTFQELSRCREINEPIWTLYVYFVRVFAFACSVCVGMWAYKKVNNF